jgi:aspartyl-tRNA(Asn)/glutamyl-tRNA(Gln) amidotransferase subunit C
MTVDADEVRRIAELARLHLDPVAIDTLGAELATVVDYVAMLDELDVADVPPTASAAGDRKPPRPDACVPSLGASEALGPAPDAAAGHFRVPSILAP